MDRGKGEWIRVLMHGLGGRSVRPLSAVAGLAAASLLVATPADAGRVADTAPSASVGHETVPLRTEFSQTRLLADGTYETRVSSVPLHYRDDGRWRAIDNALVPAGGGRLKNRANGVDVEIPAAIDGDVSYAADGRALSFALVTARPDAEVDANGTVAEVDANGTVAEFADAVGGVDVAYEVVGATLKESLTLPSADAPTVYRFDVESDGLTPQVAPSGAVHFRDAAGRTQLGFAPPWMRDADGVVSRAARYEVERDGERSRIALRLDAGWLSAPERRYPVVVDPTVYRQSEHLCEIRSGSRSNTTLCDGAVSDMWIGRDANGIVHRGLFELEDLTAAVPDYVQVLDSWFAVYLDSQTPVEPSDVDVHHLTRGFAPGATWNRLDGRALWSRPGGDFTPQREDRGSTADAQPDGWIGLDVTELVERIVSGREPSQNLLLKAADESRQHVDAFDWAEVKVRWGPRTGMPPRYTYDQPALPGGPTFRHNVGNGNLALVSHELGFATDHPTLGRWFNSLNLGETSGTYGRGSRGDFGSISLERNLQDGSYVFFGAGADDGVFHRRDDGTFRPPAGVDAVLAEQVDGTVTVSFAGGETWTFDDDGRLVRVRRADGYQIDGTYGSHGLATLADSQANTATFAYDGAGDLRTVTDELRAVRRYDYDAAHRLVAYTSPTGAQTRYAYDGEDRLQRITLPDRSGLRIAYWGDAQWPQSITPFDVLGIDQPATTFDGDEHYTVVQPPSAPRRVYFVDPYTLVVELVQIGSDAAIEISGLLPSLDGRWDDGAGPYTADVAAGHVWDGISLVELEVDGDEVDSVGPDCSVCPPRADERVSYDPSFDAEGPHTYQVNIVQGDDDRTDAPPWTIKIDRTPPTAALSGSLHDARTLGDGEDIAFVTGDSELTVDAADRWSGVASVELLVDGQRLDPSHLLTPTCTSGGCPATVAATFRLAHASMSLGDHTVSVVVRDQLAPATATTPSAHVLVEDFAIVVASPPAQDAPFDDVEDDTPPDTIAPGAEPSDWQPPAFDAASTLLSTPPPATPEQIAVAVAEDEAATPGSDLATMLGGSDYEVVTASQMTYGQEPDGETPRVIGAVLELALDDPQAVAATVGCAQFGETGVVHYQARVAASAVRDLLVRVDTGTGELLCASPFFDSDVELFEPAPNQPPLPRLED